MCSACRVCKAKPSTMAALADSPTWKQPEDTFPWTEPSDPPSPPPPGPFPKSENESAPAPSTGSSSPSRKRARYQSHLGARAWCDCEAECCYGCRLPSAAALPLHATSHRRGTSCRPSTPNPSPLQLPPPHHLCACSCCVLQERRQPENARALDSLPEPLRGTHRRSVQLLAIGRGSCCCRAWLVLL